MPAHPRRGDIWELQTDGQLEERLVVSSDTWNVLNVGEVLTLEVIAGHYDESGAYAIRVEAEGPKTIYADAILPAPRLGMALASWELGPEVMAEVEAALDRALAPTPVKRSTRRPPAHPMTGQLRLANLHIDGEGNKPVVIISGEQYAEDLDFSLVIVCRKCSNATRSADRHFEVALRSQGGAVVCSDIRTVRTQDLRPWTSSSPVLPPHELAEVRAKTREMLGLL